MSARNDLSQRNALQPSYAFRIGLARQPGDEPLSSSGELCTQTWREFPAAPSQSVAATGYLTIVERPLDPGLYPNAKPELAMPGGLVFHMTSGPVGTYDLSNWWSYVPSYVSGACWRHPEGPGRDIAAREDHPVVQSRVNESVPET